MLRLKRYVLEASRVLDPLKNYYGQYKEDEIKRRESKNKIKSYALKFKCYLIYLMIIQ